MWIDELPKLLGELPADNIPSFCGDEVEKGDRVIGAIPFEVRRLLALSKKFYGEMAKLQHKARAAAAFF